MENCASTVGIYSNRLLNMFFACVIELRVYHESISMQS